MESRPSDSDNEITNKLKLVKDQWIIKVAQDIDSHRDQLWNQAKGMDRIRIFFEHVQKKLNENGLVFSDILKNPVARACFEKRERLKTTKNQWIISVANGIYSQRDQLWNQANCSLPAFNELIKKELDKEGITLSDIVNNREAQHTFNQSVRLKMVMQDELLCFVVENNIYKMRDVLWGKACQSTRGDIEQFIGFVLLIQEQLHKHGFGLHHVVASDRAKEMFKKSDRLKLVLNFLQLQSQKHKQPKPEKEAAPQQHPLQQEAFFDRARHVKELADKAYQKGQGLITQIGGKEILEQGGEGELKRKILAVMLDQHPDRNQEGNQELVQIAAALLDLLKHGDLRVYRDKLEDLRKQDKKDGKEEERKKPSSP